MQTLRVLTVDDEPGMRRAVSRALDGLTLSLPDVQQEVTLAVETAGSGEEALSMIEAQPPDLLLLDYKLPGMTGLDVLERLQGRDVDTITVMVTAYASLETAVTATKRGADDFIAKPFTPEELKRTIRKSAAHLMAKREARRLAAERRQVRFQFLSVLVHELKAPLGAVEGYLNILQTRTLGADLRAYDSVVERCLVRCEGMRKMIYDLLDLTRIESGQRQRNLRTVDVRAAAQTAIDTATPDAQARRIAIALHADETVEMTADPTELEIVLNNLVSNAVKYNRDDGRVDVTITADDEQVAIEVADTGIGMSPAECAKLFNEFVRIKNSKTRSILGSGLGLSTVRKLAHLYGGDATVRSTPDVGSTFTVVLKRHTHADDAEHHAAGDPQLAAGA